MRTSDTSPDPSVTELLAACALGDAASFARLYDATCSRVHGLSLRVAGEPAQAEEVTQEVYRAVWQDAHRFDPARSSGLTWLLTLAHRTAVDRVRGSGAARRPGTAEPPAEALPHTPPGDAASAQDVRTALASLSQGHRDAVELAYFRGCTHREVSVLLQIPVGTAQRRIRDGLLRLRELLSQAEPQPA